MKDARVLALEILYDLMRVDPPVGARSDCVGSGGLRLPGNMTEFLEMADTLEAKC